jgi:hypothetical protein
MLGTILAVLVFFVWTVARSYRRAKVGPDAYRPKGSAGPRRPSNRASRRSSRSV